MTVRNTAIVLTLAAAMGACGKSSAPAAPAAAAATPAATAPSSAPDPALSKALACAAAGVAQQPAMLAAADKAGKGKTWGAMVAPMWAKAVNDAVTAKGGTDQQAQALVNAEIDKANAAASAGHPTLDEAALETCVRDAKM